MVRVAKVENHSSDGQVKETLLNLFILDKDGLRSKGGLYVHGWGGQH